MNTERLELRLAPELIAKLDRWREAQPVPISRAAAIRYLIETGLNDDLVSVSRRTSARV